MRRHILWFLLLVVVGVFYQQPNAMAQEATGEPGIKSNAFRLMGKLNLAQNEPEPVEKATVALIRYTAVDAYEAFIIVNDSEGRRVRTFNGLGAEGTIKVYTAGLAAGVYTYALVVNGRAVERKRMTIR